MAYFKGEIRDNTGVGPFRHDEVRERPPEIFDAEVTLYTGPAHASSVLLPVIPAKQN